MSFTQVGVHPLDEELDDDPPELDELPPEEVVPEELLDEELTEVHELTTKLIQGFPVTAAV